MAEGGSQLKVQGDWRLWACVGLGLAVRLALALGTEPYVDSVYYLAWSEHLDWSYFDHAPMIAYVLRAFGIAGTQVVASVGTVAALAWASEQYSRGSWLRAAALASLMPCFIIGGVVPNPDSVLYLFAALALGFALRGSLVLSGVALGLAMLSKYPAVLLVPALLGIGWYQPRRSRMVAAAVVALVLAMPIVWWNAKHDFAGLRFQFAHGTDAGAPGITGFMQLAAAQFAFLGPVSFVLMWVFAVRAKRPSLEWALSAGFLIPLLVFLLLGLKSRGEANWPTLAACAGVIMISAQATELKRGFHIALLTMVPIGLVGLVLLTVPQPAAPVSSPVRRMHGFAVLKALPRDVSAAFASYYGIAANVHLHTGLPVGTVNGRISQYDIWGPPPTPPGSDALWVGEDEELPPQLAALYEQVDPPTTLEGTFGPLTVHTFQVQRLRHRK